MNVCVVLVVCGLLSVVCCQTCPDDDLTLVPWSPGEQPTLDVTIDGVGYLLNDSANVNTIDIRNGGRLVIQDHGDSTPTITLRTRQILIQSGGAFIVGAEACPYEGSLDIVLWGQIGDGGAIDPSFGRKFIGTAPSGSIMMHGSPKLSWTRITDTLSAGAPGGSILSLVDDASTWRTGDQVVIASSDFDPDHSEVFTLMDCASCTANQIQITESPQYTHYGYQVSGADLRAEVGLLTRNVRVRGEMEPACYGSTLCDYFPDDIFGGHIMMVIGFEMAHFSDIELVDLGQQILGRYPMHFHRVEAAHGSYVRRLSIHHSRSRCVTLHGAQGITVEDNVGYISYGHCYFLEDGFEFNNTLRHNLGLGTKPGSLLPSDRNDQMCVEMLDDVYPGYIPDPDQECKATSTFWIAHPDNIIEDNVAAGSDEYGFFFIFHRVSTGPSAGEMPPFHGERSTIGSFSGNSAHSNGQFGLHIDEGVKTTPADEADPREFLAVVEYARFSPHVNRNLSEPRDPAVIDRFTAYKNVFGIQARGGDIIIKDSSLVDNVVGIIPISESTLPYDVGSHIEIVNTQFNGRSPNTRDDYYSTTYPPNAIEFRDGPTTVLDCVFSGYIDDGVYADNSSALRFKPKYQGQHSSRNSVRNAIFLDESRRLWMGDLGVVNDGDQTMILTDLDGSISGMTGQASHIVRSDMNILNTDGSNCVINGNFNAAICTVYEYGQVYLETSTQGLTLTVNSLINPAATPYTLTGVVPVDGTNYTNNNYQPLMIDGDGYSVHWNGVAPDSIIMSPHNFRANASIHMNLCYPAGTSFTVMYEEWDQQTNTVLFEAPFTEGTSVDDVINDPQGLTYYWEDSTRILHMQLMTRHTLSGYNYCSDQGCERYNIQATIVNQEISDCSSAPLLVC